MAQQHKEKAMAEITIQASDGAGSFKAYLAEPAGKPAGAVIMIQEIFGVNRTMRALSDWVAAMGFIAISPDLFWRQKPGVELDPDAGQTQWETAFGYMKGMDQALAVQDLKATIAAARALPGCNGKVGTMGYCLGGRLAFMMATQSDAQCHVSYYGVGLEGLVADATKITAPTLVHIAQLDKFVPPEAQAAISAGLAGHAQASVMIHPGVDHAFARLGGHSYDARAATIANGRSAEMLVKALG
jgi:carboxymethylenebutenolidase